MAGAPTSRKDGSEAYLGPPTSVSSRTTDAVAILDDGEELPVHTALLAHGVLELAVSQALDERQSNQQVRVPLSGCSKPDLILFLRLLHSLRAEDLARSMSLEELQAAGLIAEQYGFKDTLAVVEEGLLAGCCG